QGTDIPCDVADDYDPQFLFAGAEYQFSRAIAQMPELIGQLKVISTRPPMLATCSRPGPGFSMCSRRGSVQDCPCRKSFSIGPLGRWQGLRDAGDSRMNFREYCFYLVPLLSSDALFREILQQVRGSGRLCPSRLPFHHVSRRLD